MCFYLVLGFSSSSEPKTHGFRLIFDSPRFSSLVVWNKMFWKVHVFVTLLWICWLVRRRGKNNWISVDFRFARIIKPYFIKKSVLKSACFFTLFLVFRIVRRQKRLDFDGCSIRPDFQTLFCEKESVLKSAFFLPCSRLFRLVRGPNTVGTRCMFDSPGFSKLASWKRCFETCVFVYPVLVSSIGSEANTFFLGIVDSPGFSTLAAW